MVRARVSAGCVSPLSFRLMQRNGNEEHMIREWGLMSTSFSLLELWFEIWTLFVVMLLSFVYVSSSVVSVKEINKTRLSLKSCLKDQYLALHIYKLPAQTKLGYHLSQSFVIAST